MINTISDISKDSIQMKNSNVANVTGQCSMKIWQANIA